MRASRPVRVASPAFEVPGADPCCQVGWPLHVPRWDDASAPDPRLLPRVSASVNQVGTLLGSRELVALLRCTWRRAPTLGGVRGAQGGGTGLLGDEGGKPASGGRGRGGGLGSRRHHQNDIYSGALAAARPVPWDTCSLRGVSDFMPVMTRGKRGPRFGGIFEPFGAKRRRGESPDSAIAWEKEGQAVIYARAKVDDESAAQFCHIR